MMLRARRVGRAAGGATETSGTAELDRPEKMPALQARVERPGVGEQGPGGCGELRSPARAAG